MSRIAATLAGLKAQGRKALIPYVTAGDPYADATADIMRGLAEGGADIIELGVPFSDPMADGPVIQKASERALARGIGLPQVLQAVRAFRAGDDRTPVVLMGYANPVERYDQREGEGAFVRDAAIGTDLDKRYVLVVTKDHTIEYRTVTVGPNVGSLRVVRTGLAADELVVVNGLQRVRPGMKIDPVVTEMEPPRTAAGTDAAPANLPAGK